MLPGFLSRMASLVALATKKLPVRFTRIARSQSSMGPDNQFLHLARALIQGGDPGVPVKPRHLVLLKKP